MRLATLSCGDQPGLDGGQPQFVTPPFETGILKTPGVLSGYKAWKANPAARFLPIRAGIRIHADAERTELIHPHLPFLDSFHRRIPR